MSTSKGGERSNAKAHDKRADATAATSRPRMSVANAKSALSNFTLSQQSKRPSTRNYLNVSERVTSQQREAIKQQFERLATSSGPGMTIVTSTRDASKMVAAKSIDLAQLLSSLDSARAGTQFYTAGSALTDKIRIQATIDAFFKELTGGGNGQ